MTIARCSRPCGLTTRSAGALQRRRRDAPLCAVERALPAMALFPPTLPGAAGRTLPCAHASLRMQRSVHSSLRCALRQACPPRLLTRHLASPADQQCAGCPAHQRLSGCSPPGQVCGPRHPGQWHLLVQEVSRRPQKPGPHLLPTHASMRRARRADLQHHSAQPRRSAPCIRHGPLPALSLLRRAAPRFPGGSCQHSVLMPSWRAQCMRVALEPLCFIRPCAAARRPRFHPVPN